MIRRVVDLGALCATSESACLELLFFIAPFPPIPL